MFYVYLPEIMQKIKPPVMKKLLALIFVLAAAGNISAQEYFPLPDSNAIWRTNWSNNECTNLGLPLSQYQYLLTGDTIISSKEYVKIERTGFISSYCPPYSYGRPQTGYQGAYRNDVAGKKVYYVFPDSANEVLLYDFSLTAGDTVKGYFVTPGVTMCQDLLVVSVDTIWLNDQPRRRLYVAGAGCESYFMEGIGSTHGLLESPQTMEEAGELICFTLNDTLIYLSNSFETCEVISSVKESFLPENFTVTPNPAKEKITIRFDHLRAPVTIELYDMMGICRLNQSNVDSEAITLDVSKLPAGIYMLRIDNGTRGSDVSKVVLTN